ncbi:MAG: sugar phosphate isomerase/epimerase [Clostridia bacterium]|nr:sugar phosphate isomerase/epimerase [Clostridia bacterium]
MRFGACVGMEFDRIKYVKEYGYDYVESCFHALTDATDEEYKTLCDELEKNEISCEVVNCFLPGRLPLCVEKVDYDALREYIEKGFSRGKPIGLKKVVFGSGGARKVPDNYSFEKAVNQIVYFLREVLAPICEKYQVTVVIEPLQLCDSNIINTVKEGAAFAALAECEYIKGLSDIFHMEQMHDEIDNIKLLNGCIKHAHIAEPVNRVYPASKDEFDYKHYLDVLEEAGCDTCSIEAETPDFAKDSKIAIDLLRSL